MTLSLNNLVIIYSPDQLCSNLTLCSESLGKLCVSICKALTTTILPSGPVGIRASWGRGTHRSLIPNGYNYSILQPNERMAVVLEWQELRKGWHSPGSQGGQVWHGKKWLLLTIWEHPQHCEEEMVLVYRPEPGSLDLRLWAKRTSWVTTKSLLTSRLTFLIHKTSFL
jgi:hypothetical protein